MYQDLIVECPNGFAPILNELFVKGLSKYIVWDEDGITPLGIGNGVDRFYPSVPTFDTPGLAYLRLEESIYQELLGASLTSFNILTVCPAGGEYDELTETLKDIYDLLQEDDVDLPVYNSYHFHPEFTKDEAGNDIPNPRFGEFRSLGKFA